MDKSISIRREGCLDAYEYIWAVSVQERLKKGLRKKVLFEAYERRGERVRLRKRKAVETAWSHHESVIGMRKKGTNLTARICKTIENLDRKIALFTRIVR